jgi:hypothetical protein
MAEADVEQGTSANGVSGEGEQIAQRPEMQQPPTEAPAAPVEPEGPAANGRRVKIIACVALVGGGALAAIRRARRATAHDRGRRHWPLSAAMLTRKGRSPSRGHQRATSQAAVPQPLVTAEPWSLASSCARPIQVVAGEAGVMGT